MQKKGVMKIIQSNEFIDVPLVSVIIPSFNRSSLIGRTIDSILHQRYSFALEIIIGDDFSNDNVREILLDYQKSFPKIITLVFHERNLGLGANWASCVKLSRGKYIAGCDNDDFWHNRDKLELQVQFLEQNPDYGMVHTNYRELNRKTGRITEKNIHNITYSESLIKANFIGKFKCCNSSVMYRKSVIDDHINLDDFILYQFPLQDWPTWISIANFTKFKCLPVSTTTIGIENESITRPNDYKTVMRRFDREKIMYKYLCDKFPEDLSYNEKMYNDYVDHVLLNLAYTKNDFLVANEYAQKLKTSGSENIKVQLAKNRHSFHTFTLLKRLKTTLHSIINP
jgi:glycosyltransferase involved in cell wall biosynthesis